MRNADLNKLTQVRAVHKGTGAIYSADTLAAGLLAWGDIMSLDAPLPDIDEGTLHDRMRVEATQHDEAERAEIVAQVHSVLDRLPPRSAAILRLRFFEDLTLEQVGVRLGVSHERVRQLEYHALNALRSACGVEHPINKIPAKCPNGHDLTHKSSRYLRADGYWRCVQCRAEQQRRADERKREKRAAEKAARAAQAKPVKPRTLGDECPHGHDLTIPGAIFYVNGRAFCRMCKRRYQREYKRRRRIQQRASGRCSKGHDLTLLGASYLDRRGARVCVACMEERKARRRTEAQS